MQLPQLDTPTVIHIIILILQAVIGILMYLTNKGGNDQGTKK